MMTQIKVKNIVPEDLVDAAEDMTELVCQFANQFEPLEREGLFLLVDACTNARYCECHIKASKMISHATINVPLDPDEQPDYRANREIMEDHIAYEKMKRDAQKRRTFSNLVAEFNDTFKPEKPLKIIGGQHRFLAIRKALQKGIDEYHGIKVYFGLDTEQRLDVQLISNTNIAVSPDLIDRMYETVSGPELRNWCQEVGLLDKNQDFSSKRQKGHAITVRDARIFIMNYYKGLEIAPKEFDKTRTTPILAKSGVVNPEWEQLKKNKTDLWQDPNLKKAGQEFSLLAQAQREFFARQSNKNRGIADFAEKAFNYAIISAWAFIAGVLCNNKTRLKRHFSLRKQTGKDPLNASALAKGKHKSDPENYRGLGTRNDAKERGRFTELFFKQAEKGKGINKALVDAAIKMYHAKKAVLEAKEAEAKV